MDYAWQYEGTVYTPNGRAEIEDVAAHNARLAEDELAIWATVPERWQVYVTDATRGKPVTSWTGKKLGYITRVSRFSTNISRNMVALSIRGTNGADYHGRFGDDWSQLCRVRKTTTNKSPRE